LTRALLYVRWRQAYARTCAETIDDLHKGNGDVLDRAGDANSGQRRHTSDLRRVA
jgi:hypothetical protein